VIFVSFVVQIFTTRATKKKCQVIDGVRLYYERGENVFFHTEARRGIFSVPPYLCARKIIYPTGYGIQPSPSNLVNPFLVGNPRLFRIIGITGKSQSIGRPRVVYFFCSKFEES